MVAHFYLLAESFSNNDKFSITEIENKIRRFAEDIRLINSHKETNILYINYEDIYPQIFYDKYSVFDFICNGYGLIKQGLVDRDVVNAFLSIVQKAEETTFTSVEVIKELFNWVDENNCHGLIAFHKVDNLDDNLQIVYGRDGWYKFRRHFLGQFPLNEDFFIDECAKYFPGLFFHLRNKDSIKAIFTDCPKKIIYHLSALNDKFRDSQQPGLNRTQVLERFSIEARLDEEASLKGDADRKNDFTFEFVNNKGDIEKVCCEPHLKLCYSDINSSYSTNRRIYFHEGVPHICGGRILIGHIGSHR